MKADDAVPLRLTYPHGAHAALCRLLDVSATAPLRLASSEDYRAAGRKERAPVLASLAFLAVPPRA